MEREFIEIRKIQNAMLREDMMFGEIGDEERVKGDNDVWMIYKKVNDTMVEILPDDEGEEFTTSFIGNK